MQFKSAALALALATSAPGANANGNMRASIIKLLRAQLAAMDFSSGTNPMLFLKFYADNFLWSIGSMYKGFLGIYGDVNELEVDMNKINADIAADAALLAEMPAQIEALEAEIAAFQAEVDAQREQIAALTG